MLERSLTVKVQDQNGGLIWSYCGGPAPHGSTSIAHLTDGTQQRIIDALLVALIQARGELGGAPQVTNVVPYVRPPATQVDDRVPVA